MAHMIKAFCGINLLTIAAYSSLRFAARSQVRPVGKAPHQAGQLHQVDGTQECPSTADNDLWIRTYTISPLRGNRPYRSAVMLQQEAFAIPVISFADTGKPSPEQWVEWMRDLHKLQRWTRRVCILR